MNGSKKMACRVSVCLVLLSSISCIYAEELMNNETESTMPSMDFLEFLGEWETEQGEWIDPEILEDNEIEKLIEEAAEIKTNTDNEN